MITNRASHPRIMVTIVCTYSQSRDSMVAMNQATIVAPAAMIIMGDKMQVSALEKGAWMPITPTTC